MGRALFPSWSVLSVLLLPFDQVVPAIPEFFFSLVEKEIWSWLNTHKVQLGLAHSGCPPKGQTVGRAQLPSSAFIGCLAAPSTWSLGGPSAIPYIATACYGDTTDGNLYRS